MLGKYQNKKKVKFGQFSPWISQDIIKGDTIFETPLEFFIGLNTTHLKPFHLIFKIFYHDIKN